MRFLLLFWCFIAVVSVNAQKTIWLNDMPTSFFNSGWGTPKANLSIDGNPLTINGITYTKGIGTHANASNLFSLYGTALKFNAKVGLDDESSGSVEFTVKVDNIIVFQSGVMTKGMPAKDIAIDLRGAQLLEISVSDGGNGIGSDHADWVDAYITYNGKTPGFKLVDEWQAIIPKETLKDAPVALIPFPHNVTWNSGSLDLQKLGVSYNSADSLVCNSALKALIRLGTEFSLEVKDTDVSTGNITLVRGAVSGTTQAEAYSIEVNTSGVTITAPESSGLFYGVQTFRQLIVKEDSDLSVPFCTISDWPAFKIRGFMHDVGRNFIGVEEIKKQLDIFAQYKLNYFHFHLTDNPGFRLESKVYPILNDPTVTERRDDFYSMAQMNEIIEFARERHIEIIPELDMPGHSAYFERAFGFKMASASGVAIVKRLVDEWINIFDGEYFHIGTDETSIATYPAFPEEMTNYVQAKGKKVIIWHHGQAPANDRVIQQAWNAGLTDNPSIDSRTYINNHHPTLQIWKVFNRRYCDVTKGDETHYLGGIHCYWPDIIVKDEETEMRIAPVYPSMITFSERIWQGNPNAIEDKDEKYLAEPYNTERYRAFAEYEQRLASHRDRFFKNSLPKQFGFVASSNIFWRLIGPFPNGGNTRTVFEPETELKENYSKSGNTYTWQDSIWGGAVDISNYLRKDDNSTAYASTTIYSDSEQSIHAWINFNYKYLAWPDYTNPVQGEWYNVSGCQVWINGQEIAPPVWEKPGSLGGNPITDESYLYRNPTPINLVKGKNTVLIKIPRKNGKNWQFTFIPLIWENGGFTECHLSDSDLSTSYNRPTYINNELYKVYPNPANDQLNIMIEDHQPENVLFSMFSFSGENLKKEWLSGGTTNTIDISDLNTGMYVLQFDSLKGIHTQKLIVNK